MAARVRRNSFDLHRRLIAQQHIGLVLFGFFFLVHILRYGSPVTIDQYGPVIHAVPALVWALLIIASAGAVVLGAQLGGRIGARICVYGAVAESIYFMAFILFAVAAPSGVLVVIGASAILWLTLSTLCVAGKGISDGRC